MFLEPPSPPAYQGALRPSPQGLERCLGEYDVLTGAKLGCTHFVATPVAMSYMPDGNAIAVLIQVCSPPPLAAAASSPASDGKAGNGPGRSPRPLLCPALTGMGPRVPPASPTGRVERQRHRLEHRHVAQPNHQPPRRQAFG